MWRSSLLGLLIAATAHAETITVGEVDIPLGPDGFARDVLCAGSGGECGGCYHYLGPPPDFPFRYWTDGLTGTHLYEVVLSDLRDGDEVRVEFATPIRNRPDHDLYVGQARYASGSGLGLFDQSVNDFAIRFDNDPAWVLIPSDTFAQDQLADTYVVHTTDCFQWDPVGTPYEIWFTLIDLSDFGFAPDAVTHGLTIQGPVVPDWPETAGLDVFLLANLNDRLDGDIDEDGDVDLADLSRLLAAFGSCTGDDTYDADADVDRDGCVGLPDLSLLLGAYGAGGAAAGTSVTGHIADDDGADAPGCTLTLGGSADGVTVTDSEGRYRFDNLDDGTYAITPGRRDYLFLPTSAEVTVAGADLAHVDFVAFALPGPPDGEVQGTIVALDSPTETISVDDDGSVVTITPHPAAVWEGVAASFDELELGLKLEGEFYTATGIATRIKTEQP